MHMKQHTGRGGASNGTTFVRPKEKFLETALFSCGLWDGPLYWRGFLPGPREPFGRIGDLKVRGRESPRCAASGSRKEQLDMAESKVQKVARQGAARKSIGTCQCGGELIWAQVVLTRARMMRVCEKCGAFHEKDQS